MENLKIIKIGGNVINNESALSTFLDDFAELEGNKILVHGGGTKATELANKLGLQPKLVAGRRITDEANLDIVTMVYAGLVNKKIVAQLQQNDCNALGLSGADANCVVAHKRVVDKVDYGFAGDVDVVNAPIIRAFLENDIVPVFCAITHDKNGQLLNTNADTIASQIASGMSNYYEVELIYCFEKLGVLKDVDDNDSIIENIDTFSVKQLIDDQVIVEGMIPKIDNSFDALNHGVEKVIIGLPEIISDKSLKFTTLTL